MNRIKSITIFFILAGIITACQKFLEVKPDKSLTVPSNLQDLQSIMDNHSNFITVSNAGEISADDYYITDEDYASLSSDWHRRIYAWEKDYLFSDRSWDWALMYANPIYYCNTVLEKIKDIERTMQNKELYDNVKGSARFIRARTLFHATLIWTEVYDECTAGSTLGLPLRTSIDFNERSVRANLNETFGLILDDLHESVALLPEVSTHVVRPSKPAAYGLLARIYLFMGEYRKALDYADSCLAIKNTLMDYNDLDVSLANPIPQYNDEVIHHYAMAADQILSVPRARIKSEIVDSYDGFDLRKEVFFVPNEDGSMGFRARYTGEAVTLFSGIATDEIYLIRAECNARLGNLNDALADINRLMLKRFQSMNGVSRYKPVALAEQNAILQFVLKERRKELLFRGLRWYDLKRLNRDGAGIEMTRRVGDQWRVFLPNDLRYALPLPEDIIALSGMEQNPR